MGSLGMMDPGENVHPAAAGARASGRCRFHEYSSRHAKIRLLFCRSGRGLRPACGRTRGSGERAKPFDVLLRHQQTHWRRRQPRRTGRRGCSLPGTRRRDRGRRSDMARLPQHPGASRPARGQRPRPHRRPQAPFTCPSENGTVTGSSLRRQRLHRLQSGGSPSWQNAGDEANEHRDCFGEDHVQRSDLSG